MNELKILDYIIARLTEGVSTDVLMTYLAVARRMLKTFPSYDADNVCEAFFGEEDSADA